MKMGRTTRLAQAHRSGWREVLIYSREADFVPTSLIGIGSIVAEVGPLDVPQLSYAETLSSGIDVEKVMTNRAALAFKHVPLPLVSPSSRPIRWRRKSSGRCSGIEGPRCRTISSTFEMNRPGFRS